MTNDNYPSLASAVLSSFGLPSEELELAEKLANLKHCAEVETATASIVTAADSATKNLEYTLELYITIDKTIDSVEAMLAYLKEKEIDAERVEPVDENYLLKRLYLVAYFQVNTES